MNILTQTDRTPDYSSPLFHLHVRGQRLTSYISFINRKDYHYDYFVASVISPALQFLMF